MEELVRTEHDEWMGGLGVDVPGAQRKAPAAKASSGDDGEAGHRELEMLGDGVGGAAKGQPAAVSGGIDPTGTLDFAFEIKGPKSAGIVKINKFYAKPSVKVSVSGAANGDVNVGPSGGGKSSDGKGSGLVGVTADAKKAARLELTKKFDAMASSLVKAVTGKDPGLKTELFAKAKAEAKGGSKEASVSIGYDFGIDATVFGVGKGTATVKLTLAGLKYKAGEKVPVSATVLAAGVSQKLAIKWKEAFQIGQTRYDIEGSYEWGAEFEPNWAEIAKDAAEYAEGGASAAITAVIDAALVAGPPLLAAIIIFQGIVMAGEKGELDRNIIEGAIDARQAALDFANTMVGAEGSGPGPRAKAAVAAAKKELSKVASSNQVSLDELMTELRKMAPHPDFPRIRDQARARIFDDYYGEVSKVIRAWRKEHYVMAAWTNEDDDIMASNKNVAIEFERP